MISDEARRNVLGCENITGSGGRCEGSVGNRKEECVHAGRGRGCRDSLVGRMLTGGHYYENKLFLAN